MPLDPNFAGLLQSFAEAGRKTTQHYPVDTARTSFKTLSYDMVPDEHRPPVKAIEPVTVDGDEGPLHARIYRPNGDGPVPTIAFFHGGGFVMGDLDTHDVMCRELCVGANAVVLSVAYRLSPENRFPAAPRDAIAATRWVLANEATLGGAGIVGIAGDSAGGNLAAVVVQQLAASGVDLAGQFLIYPGVDGDYAAYPSLAENGSGYLIEADTLVWFTEHYVGPEPDTEHPHLMAPIKAKDLGGLAPALVVTAEFDPIRDQGSAYVDALNAAGTPAELLEGLGMVHGFYGLGYISPAGQALIEQGTRRFGALLRRQ